MTELLIAFILGALLSAFITSAIVVRWSVRSMVRHLRKSGMSDEQIVGVLESIKAE